MAKIYCFPWQFNIIFLQQFFSGSGGWTPITPLRTPLILSFIFNKNFRLQVDIQAFSLRAPQRTINMFAKRWTRIRKMKNEDISAK